MERPWDWEEEDFEWEDGDTDLELVDRMVEKEEIYENFFEILQGSLQLWERTEMIEKGRAYIAIAEAPGFPRIPEAWPRQEA